MKRLIYIIWCACIICGFAVQASSSETDLKLMLFKNRGIPADFYEQVIALGGSVDFAHDVGIAIVSGLNESAAAIINGRIDVLAIGPDDSFILNPVTVGTIEEAVVDDLDSDSGRTPNPTTAGFYNLQWNMRAIHADEAWEKGRFGSSAVTVAILDTGIDYTYPDLDGRVDLSRSASFVPVDDFYLLCLSLPEFNKDYENFLDKHPVTDLNYHGTHVASTVVSNSIFTAGVTTQTTLIGVKVCDVDGLCAISSIVEGILHAVDNGADVINMSFSGYFDKAEKNGLVGFLNRLFNYANRMGVTVVVSAGNTATDLDHDGNTYKTYCSAPNVLCISATGPTGADRDGLYDVDAIAPYSNYGRSAINVAAPGGTEIFNDDDVPLGRVWAACSQTSLIIPICQTGPYALSLSGTSMATAHVSGLASLVVEDVGNKPGRVKTRIQKYADDLGQRGVDPYYGKGRINVGATVK